MFSFRRDYVVQVECFLIALVVTTGFTSSFLSVEILAVERYETFVLEQPRPFDDAYQKDHDRYMAYIQAVLKRLAVRADYKVKETINTLRIRINNRGRAEVLTVDNTIYFDIAILDLLEHAALEFAIADINVDDYHGLEFNVSYSVALSTDKLLRGIDPYNHTRLEKEQWETLWEDVNRYQQVFYNNCLAFILAYEIGHMVLGHNDRLNREFPTENHKKSNPEKWNRLRRKMELAADDFSADLSLRSFYQPANIVPWLTAVDTRRTFYGSSPEYPDPKQREATIRSVYHRWMKAGLLPETEYIWPEPLRPDRDLTKVDKLVGLKNIQEVRAFRRNFLSVIDRQLIELLNAGTAPKAAITTVVEEVKTNRLILGTECEAPDKLDALVREIDNSANSGQIDRDRIQSLVNQACRSEDRRNYLLRFLKEDPVNWEAMKSTAALLKNSRPELSDAIQWRNILARTLLRWLPDIYQAYLDTVATYTGEKYHYKPYIVGKPLRQAPPSNQEMLDFLSKRWNGSYVQNSNINANP